MSVAWNVHPGAIRVSADCGMIASIRMTGMAGSMTKTRGLSRIEQEMQAAEVREAVGYYVKKLGSKLASAMPDAFRGGRA